MDKQKDKDNKQIPKTLKNHEVFAIILMYLSLPICLASLIGASTSDNSLIFFLTTLAISSMILLGYTTWRVMRNEQRTWKITKEHTRIQRLMDKQTSETEIIEENDFLSNQQNLAEADE